MPRISPLSGHNQRWKGRSYFWITDGTYASRKPSFPTLPALQERSRSWSEFCLPSSSLFLSLRNPFRRGPFFEHEESKGKGLEQWLLDRIRRVLPMAGFRDTGVPSVKLGFCSWEGERKRAQQCRYVTAYSQQQQQPGIRCRTSQSAYNRRKCGVQLLQKAALP